MVDPIDRLIAEFRSLPTVRRVNEAIELCSHRKVGGLWGGSAALLLAAVAKDHTGKVLIVTADDVDSLQVEADLACFRVPAAVLPRQELDDQGQPDAQTCSERHKALTAAARPRTTMIASVEALLQKAPARKALQKGRVALHKGMELQRDALLQQALAAGLRTVPLVLAPGEVSARGDVLDIFPLGADAAVRFEFFDLALESIRTFDPASQRTVEVVDRIELQLGGAQDLLDDAIVLSHLDPRTLLVVFYEPLRIEQRTSLLTSFDSGFGRGLNDLNDTLRTCAQLWLSALPSHDLDLKILSAGSAVGSGEADPLGRLRSVRGLQGRVLLLCRTDSERQRLLEIFAHKNIDLGQEQIVLQLGAISRGFRVPELSCTVLSNVEFAGVPQQARVRERTAVPSRAIQSFFELGPGDYVVHAVHGIARFVGMELVERGESAEDHLRLCFHDDVTLLVPASKIHLVQKYVGSHSGIALDKLGGKGFQRRKEQVEEALFDMAADLLEVQAARARIQRPAHEADASERDFQDAFPFRDTEDQATAWQEIRTDLEKSMPMDRLLCGDVGFGKTEVALRAVFRVALHGRQVAVLVPTTILAEQHWRTFQNRCKPFGIEVELLSRYRTKKERDEVHERMLRGQVDIVVGTHQILGSKVEWKDLALIVVDEEQR
ncbi:MAG: DEAD/DEAH box helicase, partial [Planctomycetota bacterium]